MSKRPKSKAVVESSSSGEESDEEIKTKKKQKKEEDAGCSSAKQDDGTYVFPIAKKRQVTVREFKGKLYVDIREFYEDNSGDMKPGKKGISLPVEQWEKLKQLTDDIDEAIQHMA